MSDRSPTVGEDDGLAPPPPSQWRQFQAILYKNALLQIRSRFVICGFRLGGAATVAFEVLLPVLFIAAMCLVTQLPKIPFPAMVYRSWLLSDSGWSGDRAGAKQAVTAGPKACALNQCRPLPRAQGSRVFPNGCLCASWCLINALSPVVRSNKV